MTEEQVSWYRVFENGAAYVGTDYLAHILWDKYLKFERDNGTPVHVVRLYLQILGSPLRDIDRYYTRCNFETRQPTTGSPDQQHLPFLQTAALLFQLDCSVPRGIGI